MIAREGRNRDAIHFSSAETRNEILKVTFDFFVALLAIIHEVHFVDRHDEMPDAEEVGDKCMATRLRHHSVSSIDKYYGKIAVARAGDQIPRVLLVAWRIGDDELAFGCGEITIGDIDRDALFTF